MARIRTIKPDAFSSESLAACSFAARWAFAGIWTYADDEGRGRADPRLIKAHVFPLDDDKVTTEDMAGWMDELAAVDCLRFYDAGGKRLFHIPGWGHQRINRPSPSKLPAPPADGTPPPSGQPADPPPALTEPSPPDVYVEQGREGEGKQHAGARAMAKAAPANVTEQAARLVADHPHRPDRWTEHEDHQLRRQVATLLGSGIPELHVAEGLSRLALRDNAGPGLLRHLVHDAIRGKPASRPGSRRDPNAGLYRHTVDEPATTTATVTTIDEWMRESA